MNRLAVFLQVFCFGLIAAFLLVGIEAEAHLKLVGCFTLSAILFMALHFYYLSTKDKFVKELEAKDEAAAHFNHDIRTPISTISGIAEIFDMAQDELSPKQKELVRRLQSGITKLKSLLDEKNDSSGTKDTDSKRSWRSLVKIHVGDRTNA